MLDGASQHRKVQVEVQTLPYHGQPASVCHRYKVISACRYLRSESAAQLYSCAAKKCSPAGRNSVTDLQSKVKCSAIGREENRTEEIIGLREFEQVI